MLLSIFMSSNISPISSRISGHLMWRLTMVMSFCMCLDPSSGTSNVIFHFFQTALEGYLKEQWVLCAVDESKALGEDRIKCAHSSQSCTRIGTWTLPRLACFRKSEGTLEQKWTLENSIRGLSGSGILHSDSWSLELRVRLHLGWCL